MTASTAGYKDTAQSETLPAGLPRVLIVMIDRHLGNLVISLPVIDRLASYFRGAVDVLVDERYACLVRRLRSGARILGYPEQGAKRRTPLANLRPGIVALRAGLRRYSCVIDVGGGTRSATLTLLSLSRRRVGLRDGRMSWVYSRRTDAAEAVHYFDRYARFLRFIGVDGKPSPLNLSAPREARAEIDRTLDRLGRDPGKPLAVFHVGAGDRQRIYPPQQFAAAADLLVRRFGAQVCVIGLPSERDLADTFLAAMTRRRGAFALSIPLDQLLALYERSSVLISNEGGPTHLAAMTDLPIVTLFGPSREDRWKPIRGKDVTILRGAVCDPGCRRSRCIADLKCLMGITPQDIAAAAEPYLMSRQVLSASA